MWRTPEELVEIGFKRSRVVMMNEAHHGLLRCLRTREIGRRILPTAHRLGVRYLAMEALYSPSLVEESNRARQLPEVHSGYLSQSEMRQFIQAALDLGWTLISYEADMEQVPTEFKEKGNMSAEVTNWRESMQAQNLVSALNSLPLNDNLLIWCGNGHHTKDIIEHKYVFIDGKVVPNPRNEPPWTPMGYLFKQLSRIEPFTIDQTITVNFPSRGNHSQGLSPFITQLEELGGTAGLLKEEIPSEYTHLFRNGSSDAILISTKNDME